MKRIVIDARELRTSTGRYVERLIHYLQKVDTSHEYVILLTLKDFDGWTPQNPNFTKVATPYKEFTFGEQLGLMNQLKGLQADLVHFPMVQQPILYRGKVVTTMQDLTTIRFRNPTKQWLVFTIKQQIYKFVNWYVAHKSDQIITPTKFVQDDVMQFAHIAREKITVTLESADELPQNSAPLSYLTNKEFIMYVGRPLPHKNLWRLIEAFAELRKKHPSLMLALAGKKDAAYQMIEDRAQKEGLSEGVVFTGFVSDAELRWMYENCRAYIFASLSEGFGLPGLEAMKHGAPVVSSNATCLPEVEGDAAYYFNPLDAHDMASKIDEVITNENLRAELIKKGSVQAAKYSWKRMAEQTVTVYKKALGEIRQAELHASEPMTPKLESLVKETELELKAGKPSRGFTNAEDFLADLKK